MKPVAAAALLIVIAGVSGVAYWWGTQHPGVGVPGATVTDGARKILYYRQPMGLPDISPVPKKMSDGMDYVPVYEGDAPEADRGMVRINPDKVQKLGVKTEVAQARELVRTVRAVAVVQADERRLHTVAPRFAGWVETLHVNTTGQAVERGQSLMEIYSPDLITAQEEYLIAWKGLQLPRGGSRDVQANMQQLADSAVQRLRNWGISDAELRRLQEERVVQQYLTLRSPATGVVLEKPPIAGQSFMAGELLYRIADLSSVWVLADIFESDLALVHVGQMVTIHVDAYPARQFMAQVTFVYPTVTPETRTAKVRMEVPNAAGLLKPAMFARVEIASSRGKGAVLTVPDSAVLDTGTRQLVLVQRGEGLYEPRTVKLGLRADGLVEVLDGVQPDDNVVVNANFLIDAESNLKAALGAFGGHVHGGSNKGESVVSPTGQPVQAPGVTEKTSVHEGH